MPSTGPGRAYVFKSINEVFPLYEMNIVKNLLFPPVSRMDKQKLDLLWDDCFSEAVKGKNHKWGDEILGCFLTAQTGQTINESDIVGTFRELYCEQLNSCDKDASLELATNILLRLKKYSKSFYRLKGIVRGGTQKLGKVSSDDEVDSAIRKILPLSIKYAYPLLMVLFELVEDNKITKKDFLRVLRALEIYLVRHHIVGSSTLNQKFFHELAKYPSPGEDFCKRVTEQLYSRAQTDHEFYRQGCSRPLYSEGNRRKPLIYLLNALNDFNAPGDLTTLPRQPLSIF